MILNETARICDFAEADEQLWVGRMPVFEGLSSVPLPKHCHFPIVCVQCSSGLAMLRSLAMHGCCQCARGDGSCGDEGENGGRVDCDEICKKMVASAGEGVAEWEVHEEGLYGDSGLM